MNTAVVVLVAAVFMSLVILTAAQMVCGHIQAIRHALLEIERGRIEVRRAEVRAGIR